MNVHFFSAKGRRMPRWFMRVESRLTVVNETDGVLVSASATDGRRLNLELGLIEAHELVSTLVGLELSRKAGAR